MNSIRRRLLVSTLVGSIILTITIGLFLAIIFELSIEKQFDSRLEFKLSELVSSAEFEESSLLLKPGVNNSSYGIQFSGWYWEMLNHNNQMQIYRSKSMQETSIFSMLSDEHKLMLEDRNAEPIRLYMTGPIGEPLRVYVQLVHFPELRSPIVFLVSGNSSLMQADVEGFYRLLAMALGFLVVALTLATYFQLRFVLNPLRQLKNYLAEIRKGKGKSMKINLPEEVMPVANEINSLLEANENVVTRARTHVGNLAHGLKTPISVLLNAAEKKEDKLDQLVKEQVGSMNHQISHHLNRARMIASLDVVATQVAVVPVIDPIINALSKINQHKNIKVDRRYNDTDSIAFLGEKQDLEELVGNLIDNAFKWCDHTIFVCIEKKLNKFDIEKLHIVVEDDGSFMPEQELENIIKRGHRIDEKVDGSGLGLSIVKELAELYDGEFSLSQSDLGGLKAELWLPCTDIS